MRVYARVEAGVVREIINPVMDDVGVDIPIDQCFPAQLVAQMIEVTDVKPAPDQGWLYEDGKFSARPPYKESQEETIGRNEAEKSQLMAYASQVMTPLLVALQLGNATDDEVNSAKTWQAYYRSLTSVDISVVEPAWPVQPAHS